MEGKHEVCVWRIKIASKGWKLIGESRNKAKTKKKGEKEVFTINCLLKMVGVLIVSVDVYLSVFF